MRVLHVIPDHGNDPVTMIFVHRQIASLTPCGIQSIKYFLAARKIRSNIIGELRELRRSIQEVQPDLVHVHYGGIVASFVAVATGSPLVVTYLGSDLNPTYSIRPWRAAIERLLSQLASLRARRVICVSRSVADRLRWRQSKIAVIPAGVDLKLFSCIDRDAARSRLGWPLHEPIVFFNAGKPPNRNKRPDLAREAIEVASCLLDRTVRLHAVFGDTPPAEIPPLMNACDSLILTSEFEGSPNVVKEAMACGLPIISVDVGDVAERLADVVPSAVVPASAQALGEALAKVIRDGRRSNGRGKVAAISLDVVAGQIVCTYEEALSTHPPSVSQWF